MEINNFPLKLKIVRLKTMEDFEILNRRKKFLDCFSKRGQVFKKECSNGANVPVFTKINLTTKVKIQRSFMKFRLKLVSIQKIAVCARV
ncbi:hypothetical protein LEP1GSC108_4164 [Leptospira weilii str. UI 13098]|uniref:Uncharacterized protein n=1 Tax=Leptospira weilii str. UI 13098 TaxID=1088542 RepID=M6Q5P9_9LEPT|nr:hypothetical protein LEP1GSC108_4164 [Leptospira weilii str. UI 13098]